MYCANVFYCYRMYSSIIWNPTSSLAAATKAYFNFPSGFCYRIRPVIRLVTWY